MRNDTAPCTDWSVLTNLCADQSAVSADQSVHGCQTAPCTLESVQRMEAEMARHVVSLGKT